SYKRVVYFVYLTVLTYALLILYLAFVEQRTISFANEFLKIVWIYIFNIYTMQMARVSKEQRKKTVAAIRLAKDLVQQLKQTNAELTQSHKRAHRIFSALAEALPGTVLDDKYRLESKIGEGGFGAVYRAWHLGLQSAVAVKIFRPAPGNDSADNLERFRREGISSARVNHPNSVTMLDSGITVNGIAYLVMELLQGHTLTDELNENGKLPPTRCVEIIIPVCAVLAEAHAAGIVHRDIKPDNIYLHQSEKGEVVKLIDFGIAKLQQQSIQMEEKKLTLADAMLGTPIYMSPELLQGNSFNGQSDIYSLGVVMYQMLSGQVPFESGDGGFYAIMIQHLTQAPKPLREIDPTIPATLEKAVLRTLKKDPLERPTAKELEQELTLALGLTSSC
ncbi:MAG: serine/threonine-protein kinase, partial [Acidobacteriota bacterium]